ncbi:hypothetical protein [Vibrio renipiscarius]|uniref:Uncharacterized protein n=1 Tax=Vibrio renipiscarius TaxID=1461322 RepID=A0A0C2NPJ1_9VIBR|nr:hypothetical protein [Vibrio renipiscarius]KII76027.1 hypothetical protein OJ16_14450 [Vibrio renipiscarius]KII79131.1 hypothetical protein PL18_09910 [Vibrio renipiscarius]
MKMLKWGCIVTGWSLASFVQAEVMTADQLDSLFQDKSVAPAALVEQFNQHSFIDNITPFLSAVAQKRNDDLPAVLSLLLTQHPQHVNAITNAARELGVSNQAITIAAIEAGIDPTVIASATAAGIEAEVATPVPNPPTKKDPISGN